MRGSAAEAAAERAPALDATLAALADPTRRCVIDLLRAGPRRAGELASAAGASAPAMSRHLRVLRQRGLVEEARDEGDSRARVFRLRRERFDEVRAWLDQLTVFWEGQLEAFRDHVELTRRRKPS